MVALQIEEVEVASLKRHPRQDDVFAQSSPDQIKELAADMQERGQQEAIQVCADLTIVRGHQRVAAAELLGWKTIEAVIRHEFEDPNAPEVVEDLINDNLIRRHSGELERARAYQVLKQSQGDGRSKRLGNTRDLLAKRLGFGKSGRSMDRLMRLLTLPKDIQELISAGQLKKSHAERVLTLSQDQRDRVIADLRADEPVKVVLRRHGILATKNQKSAEEIGRDLLAMLHRERDFLADHIEELDRVQIRGGDAVDALDEAIELLSEWRDRKKRLRGQSLNELRNRLG